MRCLALLLLLSTSALATSGVAERHRKIKKRVLATRQSTSEAARLNCTTYDYKTPVSLAEGSLNSTHGCGKTYKVKSGDSCHSILGNSNSSLSFDTFRAINPIIQSDCWNLEIGTSYCVGTTPCLAESALSLDNCTSYARAASNDTYRSFGRFNKVSLVLLRAFNPNASDIEAGRFYCVSNGTHPVVKGSRPSDPPTAEAEEEEPPSHFGEQPVAKPADPVEPTTSKKQEPTRQEVIEKPSKSPEPESKPEPKPAPKPAPEPEKKPEEPEEPAVVDPPSSQSSKITMHGDATFFAVGLGSCGYTDTDDMPIAAASAQLYDLLGNDICNKKITIHMNGNSVEAVVRDKCPPCTMGSIDLSPSAFQKLAPLSVGRAQMTWDPSSLGPEAVAKLAAAGF